MTATACRRASTAAKVKLLTRKGLDWTVTISQPIAAALKKLPVGSALIDGEIVVQDENGMSSFSGLQSDLKSGRKDRLVYIAFDLLYLEGVDHPRRQRSSIARRRCSRRSSIRCRGDSIVRFSDHLDGDGETVLAHACRLGLEGIISKRTDLGLPLRPRRTLAQIQMRVERQEFVVLGYVPSTAAEQCHRLARRRLLREGQACPCRPCRHRFL